MRQRTLLTLLLLQLLSASSLVGQAKMERGPHHEKLDFLVGEWVLESKSYFRGQTHASESKANIRWLRGGVWLEEDLEMETPIGPMAGSARIAWDEKTQEYVRYYVDNQSVVVLPSRGRFIQPDLLEFKGSFDWLDGTVFHTRRLLQRLPDGWKETGYMGTDPDNLPLNHEGRARKAVAQEAPPE